MRTFEILTAIVLFGFIEAKDDNHKGEEKAILDKYFSGYLKGYTIELSRVDEYPAKVIEMMNRTLAGGNGENKYEIMMNPEVNSLLYNQKKVEFPAKPVEAFFESLELILPSPELKQLKKELKKFHWEEPELAQELINRLILDLDNKYHYTYDLVKYMKRMYSRWIPLGRLARFIAANGKN